MNKDLDKKGGTWTPTISAEVISSFLEESDWIDIWRQMHGSDFQFTWVRRNPIIMHRLDYILVPMGTLNITVDCQILVTNLSDHNPVLMELELASNLRGPGFWKLNNRHLCNIEYVNEVNETLDMVDFRYKECSPLSKWEMLKNDVRETSMSFARRYAGLRNQRIKDWQKKLKSANKKLAMINLSSERAVTLIQKVNEKIDDLKAKLDKEMINDSNGAILRAKARWVSQAERNTKYFYALEKRNAKAKTMSMVYDEKGNLVVQPEKILKTQQDFYSKLYTKDDSVNCKLDFKPETSLNEEQKKDLDKEITLEEVQHTIKKMAKGKSPGTSGFAIDLYIVFWQKIKEHFMEMLNFVLKSKHLHESALTGIISLLPKKDRDLKKVQSWRPIVLLNSDFKIISKVIAERIKPLLPNLIHKDQSGFVAGRNIADNLRKILDIFEYADKENMKGLFIAVDFLKAFDRVHYQSVYRTLEWMNFGPKIIEWIEILFTDFKLCTVNNGYTSAYFTPTRGLFQGNPIASILFVILIEPLAIMLRNSKKIKGLKIRDIEYLLIQFADDLGLFLDFDQRTWSEVEQIFARFQKMSGMLINYEKTSVYRLGSLRNSNAKFYSQKQMTWSNKPIKVLGLVVSMNQQEVYDNNIKPILAKIESILKLWAIRGLSLFGKIQVLNSLIASLFVYPLAVTKMLSTKDLAWLDSKINNFLWNERRPKIPLNILRGLKANGGAGLVNIGARDCALKLQWISKLFNNYEIKNLAYAMLDNPLGDELWNCNMRPEHVNKCFNAENFWTQCLFCWASLNTEQPLGPEEAMNEILWYNSNICINSKPVFYKEMFEGGILRVKDLIGTAGQIMNYQEIQSKIKVDFLKYRGLTSAIPKEWKNWIKSVNLRDADEDNREKRVTRYKNAKVKKYYFDLAWNDVLLQTKALLIEREINEKITIQDLVNLLSKINRTTISIKLRSFQYRLYMKAVITNIHLKLYKIRDNDLCDNCNEKKETIKHMLYDCIYVKRLWNILKVEYDMGELTYAKIFCNNVNPNDKDVENCIVLITKFYVYRSRCMKQRLSITSCLNYVKQYEMIEKEIAKQNDKMYKHNMKWKTADQV